MLLRSYRAAKHVESPTPSGMPPPPPPPPVSAPLFNALSLAQLHPSPSGENVQWEHSTVEMMEKHKAESKHSSSSSPTSTRKRSQSDPYALCGQEKYTRLSRMQHSVHDSSTKASTLSAGSSPEGGFDKNAKERIVENGTGVNECWICDDDTQLNYCHVMANAYSKTGTKTFQEEFLEKNLIDFTSVKSSRNGVRLCVACHPAYDDDFKPSLFFFPQDLIWFYNREILDRARRRRELVAGNALPNRWRMDMKTYQEYQVEQSQIEEGAHPRYIRLVLSRQTNIPRILPFEPGFCELGAGAVKGWGGSPMATLHKTFASMFRILSPFIPRHEYLMLRRLQELYSKPISIHDGDEEYLTRSGDNVIAVGSPADEEEFGGNGRGKGKEVGTRTTEGDLNPTTTTPEATLPPPNDSFQRAWSAVRRCEAQCPPSPPTTPLSPPHPNSLSPTLETLPPYPVCSAHQQPTVTNSSSLKQQIERKGVKRRREDSVDEAPATNKRPKGDRDSGQAEQSRWMMGPSHTAEDAIRFHRMSMRL